jgi:hypothetical protein
MADDANDSRYLDKALSERRSLERALADLVAKYNTHPSPELARTIRHAEAELKHRKRSFTPRRNTRRE